MSALYCGHSKHVLVCPPSVQGSPVGGWGWPGHSSQMGRSQLSGTLTRGHCCCGGLSWRPQAHSTCPLIMSWVNSSRPAREPFSAHPVRALLSLPTRGLGPANSAHAVPPAQVTEVRAQEDRACPWAHGQGVSGSRSRQLTLGCTVHQPPSSAQ